METSYCVTSSGTLGQWHFGAADTFTLQQTGLSQADTWRRQRSNKHNEQSASHQVVSKC